jgi:2-polyprenyl-3-methyl-5-hydroxy-6-metoxy-1,4-benzoquinol methylase
MMGNDDANEWDEAGAAAPPRPQDAVEQSVGPADFSRREFALREWMDGPSTFAEYCAGALDLERVNRATRGYKPTLDFMERVVAKTGVGDEPLHVLDVGCGHGDGLRAIYRWAAKRSVPLRLTGVDLNPYAARLARECDRKEHVSAGTIAWITGDVFEVRLERPPDVIVSSLFAHHLPDEAVLQLLRWKAKMARVAWMVSDLRRSERAAEGFAWLAWLLRWDAMVKHDGAMSFRRAMTVEEWREHLREAGVRGEVKDVGLGRLRVTG